MSDDDDNVVSLRPRLEPGEVIAEVGGPVDEASVTLAIYGDELDPDEVSAKLGVRPTSAHRRGDRRRPDSPPYRAGAWLWTRRGMPPVGPEELLAELVATFPLEDAAVWAELRSRYSVQLRWGIHMTGWNRGFGIDSVLIHRISGVVESFGFDIYAYGEEDDEDEG